jgi:hypothetical protein
MPRVDGEAGEWSSGALWMPAPASALHHAGAAEPWTEDLDAVAFTRRQ